MEFKNFFEKFTHDHPFILKEEHKHDDNSVPPCCLVCGKQIISDPFYCCDECDDIFIHKSCTELPLKLQHPFHPEHPLDLTSPSTYGSFGYYCDACRNKTENFVYHCSLCNLGLDLVCASVTERTVDHPSHKHPLRILQRTTLSFCDACGTKHEGFFYACSTCDQFWIHQYCASLPTMFENTDYHDHPLTLAYSLPSQYTSFLHFCEICEKIVIHFLWVYHCEKCRFLVHVDCVTQKTEHFLSVLLPNKEFYSSRRATSKIMAAGDSDLDVVHLPLQDEFLSLVDHFHKGIQLLAEDNPTVEHIHHHGIVLSDDVQGNDDRLDILHDHVKYQKKLCNLCIMPTTSTPFYECVDHKCDFILHKCCAELPNTTRHPFHSEHQLVLCSVQKFRTFMCEGCKCFCSNFVYYCADCDYILDVICATLPSRIKHEAHKQDHPMSLKKKISRHCNACYNDRDDSTFAFHCDSCDFELHARCATLPLTTRHRYDEIHPYKLTYRPIEDHYSDYCCDICETEINPLWWFYHCVDCDKSMHTLCHPTFDWRSRIKFGGVLRIDCHPHPLHMVPVIIIDVQCNGYVRVITEGSICSKCGEDFCCGIGGYSVYYPVGFKCLECKYKIHYLCLLELANEGINYIEIS